VSQSGRKQHRSPDKRSGSDHAHRSSHKGSESEKKPASRSSSDHVRSAGYSPHHSDKHTPTKPATKKKGLGEKMANFFRGGVRATIGRMMKGNTDDASHSSHKPHSTNSHSTKSSKSHGVNHRH
jgi:hypothetical protein